MIEGYNNKFLQTFDYETTAISNKKIIGTCELGKATIQLLNESNDFSDMKETWIKTKFGSFYIYDVKPVQEKVNIKLSCYDVKYKLDTEYDSSLYTWPMTLKEWRNAIFTNCNVTFDNSDFPNSNLLLDKEPSIGNVKTNRQVICIIAQASVSWVETDSSDKFYFKWFTTVEHTIEDWNSLTTEKTPTKPINLAVLSRGDVEDIVYYPKVKPDNPVEFKIDSNYILDPQDVTTNEDLREATIIPIYNRVSGFKYIVFKMTTMQVENKLSINLGDKIKYIDTWENELESYVMKRKISYIGGDVDDDDNYEIELSAETIDETNSNLKLGVDVVKQISDIGVKVDKQNEIIQLLNSKVDDTTQKVSKIEMKSDQITSSVSSLTDVVFGKEIYELTDDAKYMDEKEYYTLNEDNEYVLLVESIDYNIGDNISSSVYERSITQGLEDEFSDELNNLNVSIDQVSKENNNNYQEIKEKFDDYTPTSKTIELEKSVETIQTNTYTKTEINTKLIDGSVTKVQTTSGTFDESGMHYEKTGAKTSSTINEKGVSVETTQNNDELLFAGYDEELKESIVRTENLTVRKYFVCGNNSRFEDYTDENGNVGTGVFDI